MTKLLHYAYRNGPLCGLPEPDPPYAYAPTERKITCYDCAERLALGWIDENKLNSEVTELQWPR